MTVFEANGYKEFIRSKIKENKDLAGYKSKLANASGCRLSYLSQVLHGPVHLTPDHAIGLAHFWKLSKLESAYFTELVNLARAATPLLKRTLEDRLTELRRKHDSLSKRVEATPSLQAKLQQIYYSSWHYCAIHILVTIPDFQITSAISQKLNLSVETTLQALAHLEKMGLVMKKNETWQAISFDLHLPSDSTLTATNHSNWRHRALLDVNNPNTEGIHYTAVVSLSEDDLMRFKQYLLKFIEESRAMVARSPAETLVAFTCDLFKL